MKKTKILTVLAVSFVVAGLIIATAGLYAANFDFSKLSLARLTSNIHTVEEDFTKISIDTAISDVRLELSEDGSCQVVCMEEINYTHKVSVEHQTLTITTEDNRMWYEKIGINFGDFHNVTVRLPKEIYEELTVTCRTADVEIPKGFSFGWADIITTTGDIRWQGSQVNNLKLSVSTGDIFVNDTGCQNLTAETSTGDIRLSGTVVTQSLTAKTSTGDVRFEKSDGKAISVQTGTGDVTGSLLSGKIYVVDNKTGKVVVPPVGEEAAVGELFLDAINQVERRTGVCEITTGTGDIRIELALDS